MGYRGYNKYRHRDLSRRINRAWTELRWHWFDHTGDRSFVRGIRVFAVSILVLSSIAWIDITQNRQELHCLTENVYHEARGEDEAGQLAVAQVTMNRVASKFYPDSVCEVVFEKRWDRIRGRFIGMFSWTTLDRNARIDAVAWQHAHDVAAQVYSGYRDPALADALFYHADYVNPSWARTQVKVARIGSHIFYR